MSAILLGRIRMLRIALAIIIAVTVIMPRAGHAATQTQELEASILNSMREEIELTQDVYKEIGVVVILIPAAEVAQLIKAIGMCHDAASANNIITKINRVNFIQQTRDRSAACGISIGGGPTFSEFPLVHVAAKQNAPVGEYAPDDASECLPRETATTAAKPVVQSAKPVGWLWITVRCQCPSCRAYHGRSGWAGRKRTE